MTKDNSGQKKTGSNYFMKYAGGYKSAISIAVISVVVVTFMSLHEVSESWAWEIAKSLITINGIVLGFIIVGVNLIFSERINSISQKIDIIKKHWENFFKELKLGEIADSERVKEKMEKSLESAFVEIFVPPYSITTSMSYLVVSIVFALTLFGVSDTTIENPILPFIYPTILTLSIGFFITGVYLAIKFMQSLVSSFLTIEIEKALKEYFEAFEKAGKKEKSGKS